MKMTVNTRDRGDAVAAAQSRAATSAPEAFFPEGAALLSQIAAVHDTVVDLASKQVACVSDCPPCQSSKGG